MGTRGLLVQRRPPCLAPGPQPTLQPREGRPPTSWSLTHRVRQPARARRGRSRLAVSGRPAWPLPSGPGPPVHSRTPAARHSREAGLCLLTPPRASPQSLNFPPQQSGQSWPGKRRLLPQTSTLSRHLPGVLLCHRRGVSCTPPAGRCLQRAGQHCPPHGLLPRKRNWGPWTPALYTPTKSASPGPTADCPGNTDGSVTKPGPVALSKDPLRPEALHPNHQTGHKTRHWTLDTARQATWPGRKAAPVPNQEARHLLAGEGGSAPY